MFKRLAKCIAFANIKGGTGKTTTCINIAGYLAKSGNKVLVVDFDPQANATSGLGIDGTTIEYSMYDAFLNQCQGYDGIPITKIVLETSVENIHLVPSSLNLGVASMLLQGTRDKTGILKRIIEPVKSFYDYILIDVPSDTGLFMLNSLRAAEQIVIPLDPSIFSLEALEYLKTYCRDIEEMSDHVINQITVVLNRAIISNSTQNSSGKPSPSEEIESRLKELPDPVFVVPQSLLIYRSQQEGLPISHYATNTGKIGKAYEAIATHLSGNSNVVTIPEREAEYAS
ncbi:MAG TPA: chromosome partitioning protein [Cyanobacteria bacterium UBA8803]|nr:chromosome partitioning protein [Cyanobacteria bacterium UBA9273]HBL59873.1 chromosome partitioning protein [Cyanobacteria bacterium UBA8803]